MIEKMYVGVRRSGRNKIQGVHIAVTQDAVMSSLQPGEKEEDLGPEPIDSFRGAIDDYINHINGVGSSVPLLLTVLPIHQGIVAEKEIHEEATRRGLKISTDGESDVFEIDISDYPYFLDKARQLGALSSFSHVAPGIFLVGLVSIYDAYLGHLLRAIFRANPERIDGSDRQITFEQIAKFSSLEDAREYIVRREVEAVLRNSHSEQIEWLERNLSMPLRKGLDCWAGFVEICERRNLWTHNKGIVSQQYIDVCTQHGVNLDNVRLGDQLIVSATYFQRALDVFCELGVKLGHTLWRKILVSELAEADSHLVSAGFNLIKSSRYGLAAEILKFGCEQKRHADESLKRKLIVNWANAVKLGAIVPTRLKFSISMIGLLSMMCSKYVCIPLRMNFRLLSIL